MIVDFDLPERIAGFAEEAARSRESLPVVFKDLSSSEDGVAFLVRLEQVHSAVFSRIPGLPQPAQIASIIVSIAPSLRARAFVNEPMQGSMRLKRTVEAGAGVTLDDILDVDRLRLSQPVSPDHAVISLLSHGWRRSLYFDFSPLHVPPVPIAYDFERALGIQHAALLFQHRNRLSESAWQRVLAEGWFPFAFFSEQTITHFIGHAEAGWPIQELLDDGTMDADLVDASTKAPAFFAQSIFEPHMPVLKHAFDRFGAGDYISACSILYPRIEGVLRMLQVSMTPRAFKLPELIESVTTTGGPSFHLMPARFASFLTETVFRNFSDPRVEDHLSRHTIAHGVARSGTFNRKAAAVAMLTLLQLALYVPAPVQPTINT